MSNNYDKHERKPIKTDLNLLAFHLVATPCLNFLDVNPFLKAFSVFALKDFFQVLRFVKSFQALELTAPSNSFLRRLSLL